MTLHLNTCPASAIAAALRYDELEEGRPHVPSPSRLFSYYHERVVSAMTRAEGPAPVGHGCLSYAFVGSPHLTGEFWTMRRVS